MAKAPDFVMQELYMLTGVVDRDVDYLYYLLVKDGTMNSGKVFQALPESDDAVDTLESWFEEAGV